MAEQGESIEVSSGFGVNTQLPYVEIVLGKEKVQMSPETARGLALNILSCAESAITDAFTYGFFKSEMELSEEVIGSFLLAFRDWRIDNDPIPGSEPV